MSDSTFRRLGTLIDQISSTGFDAAEPLDELTEHWEEAVGNEVASHTAITLEGSELLVMADTPVWGHLLTQQMTYPEQTNYRTIGNRGVSENLMKKHCYPNETCHKHCASCVLE